MHLLHHLAVCAAAFAPRRAKASPTCQDPLLFSPSPIAAVPGEGRAYRSTVSVAEADIADQRSSKLAAASLFAWPVKPFNIVAPMEATLPSVAGARDLMLAAVAAAASRAIAANPVIVRCLVISTSYCGP
jgi:hypothetical protein